MQREALRWILLILPRTVPTLDAFCRSELSATVRSCKIESQYSQSNVNFNSRHRSKIHLHHIAIVRCPGIKVFFFCSVRSHDIASYPYGPTGNPLCDSTEEHNWAITSSMELDTLLQSAHSE